MSDLQRNERRIMGHCALADRTILAVSGDDAEGFLNRLFTRNLLGMEAGEARFAALLSPQGKLLFDVLVYARVPGFWLDVAAEQAADLARKLTMFKLRAKVTIESRADLAVSAAWGGTQLVEPGPTFRDPRHDGLGHRRVTASQHASGETDAAYEAHRIALGVPKGGADYAYGDAFVHDANLDLLHGVDFDKGCYVGQEVVSRVHHRGSARKRVVKLAFFGDPPAVDTALAAGTAQIGQVTSVAGRVGLAAVRIDRLADAESTSIPVLAGETLVGITLPVPGPVQSSADAEEAFFGL